MSDSVSPLQSAIKEYIDMLSYERGRADNTLVSYKSDLMHFSSYISGYTVTVPSNKISEEQTPYGGNENLSIKTPEDVTTEVIRNFFSFLTECGMQSTSAARYYSSIKGFFLFMIVEGRLKNSPLARLPSPRISRKLPETLTIEEMEKLISIPQGDTPKSLRDRAMLETLYACGLRVSELINLSQNDLSLADEVIRVFGKGDKERITPIGSSAIYWLKEYIAKGRPLLAKQMKSENYVFLNLRGKRISRMGVWKIINKYVLLAGIKKHVHPHLFRHSFATHMIEGGADLRAVQEMLGHADISTTQIYTHLDIDFVRQEHTAYHPRG